MRIIVIGAGIAGSSLTRLARSHGHVVDHISQGGEPYSTAAVAALRRAYHKGSERIWFDRTLEIYERWGVKLARGAWVTSYRAAGSRPDNDWRMVDPAEPLVKADFTAKAESITGATVRVSDEDGLNERFNEQFSASAVVNCTGSAMCGQVTWGGTWVCDDPAVWKPDTIMVHHVAPYKSIVGGVVGGKVRLGSSSTNSPRTARIKADDMFQAAYRQGWFNGGPWHLEVGARGKTLVDGAYSGRYPNGAYWLGGFHRTGYALAPAVAEDLLRQIETAAR